MMCRECSAFDDFLFSLSRLDPLKPADTTNAQVQRLRDLLDNPQDTVRDLMRVLGDRHKIS